jgi:hypothetical protein
MSPCTVHSTVVLSRTTVGRKAVRLTGVFDSNPKGVSKYTVYGFMIIGRCAVCKVQSFSTKILEYINHVSL